MENPNWLILLCGPPGVGKSTIGRLLADRTGAELLSTERFKRRVYSRLLSQLEREMGKKGMVLEGTFYRREWREKIEELARYHKTPILTVLIKASLQTCLRRDAQRERPVGEKGVKIIHAEFEEPEKPDLLIDSEEVTPEQAVERILRAARTKFGTSPAASESLPPPPR
ncbi:MAG: ATP-binding protein [Candidatus Hadarchaeales archaeon]